MFQAGLENMFAGDAGAVTYLFVLCAAAVLYVVRMSPAGGSPVRRFLPRLGTGALLLAVSRFLLIYLFGRGLSWTSVIAYIMALAGLYFLFVSAAGVQAGRDRPVERISGSTPAIVCAGACFAAATMLAAVVTAGMVSNDPFWRQLFILIDISGFFALCVSSVCAGGSAREPVHPSGDAEPVRVERPYGGAPVDARGNDALRRIGDIARSVANDLPGETIYGEIAEAIRRDARVDYVLLRIAGPGDDYYKAVACAGVDDRRDTLRSVRSVSRETAQALCREDRSCRNGYLLRWDDLDWERDSFAGSSIAREGKNVFVSTVTEGESVKGFFVLGFFEAAPAEDIHELVDLYTSLTLQVIQRERGRETLSDTEKTLAACREDIESINQLKSNFISIVSHELRTPLTSVKAYTETLLDNLESVERKTIRDFLRVMDEESERLIKLVDSILHYSCMETGLLKVEKTSCNINDMISGILASFRQTFLENRVDCDLRVPKHSVIIDADRELIQQLLQNLLGNAVKFTPLGGKVTVTVEEEAAAARITVQDTGKGIPEDQLEKIFERFHQADASNTREFGGSGLGLAICKNIVDWHDGQIWVENVKDAGAKFVVLLPMNNIVIRQAPSAGLISSVRFERERYLTLLVEMLSEILQARKASIMLLDDERQVLRIIAAKGLDPEFVENTQLEIGDRIAGRVMQTGESLHVFDIERDIEWGHANNSMFYGTHSFICVPLRAEGKVVGVLNVSDHVDGREFTDADRELLEALGSVIAGMLKKLEAFERLSSNFEDLKEVMRKILEIRETWGSKNLTNLTLLALEVGQRLGLDEKSLTALRLGMNLYDLGMMKIPRSIRGKREELTEKEWQTLREHPNTGYALISPMGLEGRIMKIIRSHHENFDGSGYPDGLAGDEIPMESRIVNVVDTFRALITQGPYRRCFSLDEARNEIIKDSGTKFDPKIVSAFMKALHDLGAVEDQSELVLTTVERELEERVSHTGRVRDRNEQQTHHQEPVKEAAP